MSTVYKRKNNNTQMVTFPRITLCLNSAHSRFMLDRIHPDFIDVAKGQTGSTYH